MVVATSTVLGRLIYHYVLSIDVRSPWSLRADDLYPALQGGEGWVAAPWFTGHAPTPCVDGSRALASGCVSALVRSAADIPPIHNTRPIMVQNDSRAFDLLELAPVVGGWVLLGEAGRYVRMSRDRFERVTISPAGIAAELTGSEGESTEMTALEPAPSGDWAVRVKRVEFGSAGRANVSFGATL